MNDETGGVHKTNETDETDANGADSMKVATKVLFLPINETDVRTFFPVYRLLLHTGVQITAISHDRYFTQRAAEALGQCRIPFRRVEDYHPATAAHILGQERPSLLVVLNDTFSRIHDLVTEARRNGIPVLLVQSGIFSPHVKALSLSAANLGHVFSAYTPRHIAGRLVGKLKNRLLGRREVHVNEFGSFADRIAAYGEFSKRLFVQRGVPAGKIVVTGGPNFDRFSRLRPFSAAERRAIGLDPRKKIVLMASSEMAAARLWTTQEVQRMARLLSEAIGQVPEAQLWLRPHPREPLALFSGAVGDVRNRKNVIVSREGDIYRALRTADVVLTDISTCGLEALLMQKPLGIVDFTGRGFVCQPYPEVYIRGGVAIHITRGPEAAGQIRDLLTRQRLRNQLRRRRAPFIRDQVYRLDGRASGRIATLILKMARAAAR